MNNRISGLKSWMVLMKGTSKNALFPRLRCQLRARILMYYMYTAVLRSVLPCTHEKITIFRGVLKLKNSKEAGLCLQRQSYPNLLRPR